MRFRKDILCLWLFGNGRHSHHKRRCIWCGNGPVLMNFSGPPDTPIVARCVACSKSWDFNSRGDQNVIVPHEDMHL